MFKRFWLDYIPYGAIDVILGLAVITELINRHYSLLWANLPVLLIGLWSFNRKLKSHDPAD